MTTDGATDVFAVLAVAQANWPHDPVAGSEAVWRKWRGLLGSFSFEEVRAALDSMVRAHRTLPPFSELLGELARSRRLATSRAAGDERRADCGGSGWRPPVDLPDDYVIGPCSAAFAARNGDGWTTERLIECVRMGRALAGCEPALVESGHEDTADPSAAPQSRGCGIRPRATTARLPAVRQRCREQARHPGGRRREGSERGADGPA